MGLLTSSSWLDDFLTMFLVLSVATQLLYFSLAGAGYCFFVMRNKDTPAAEKSGPQQVGNAIGLSMVSIFCNALLTAAVVVLVARGWSRVYFAVQDYGWGYLLFSMVALLFFTETLVYWIHRALHVRFLYKLLHRYHHAFRAPTPWVSMAFHPLDSFAQAVPYHLFAFLFPVHVGIYAGALVILTVWTFLIHEPGAVFPGGWLNFAAHHEVHHTCSKFNYGQFFTLWDRLGNTYRNPEPDASDAGIP